jgi:hypothetical protein
MVTNKLKRIATHGSMECVLASHHATPWVAAPSPMANSAVFVMRLEEADVWGFAVSKLGQLAGASGKATVVARPLTIEASANATSTGERLPHALQRALTLGAPQGQRHTSVSRKSSA